jgi:hypothetical protein
MVATRAKRYADPVNRRAWISFASCQSLGLLCGATGSLSTGVGPALWTASLIALIPGNILSALIVERSLWRSSLDPKTMAIFAIPVMRVINCGI